MDETHPKPGPSTSGKNRVGFAPRGDSPYALLAEGWCHRDATSPPERRRKGGEASQEYRKGRRTWEKQEVGFLHSLTLRFTAALRAGLQLATEPSLPSVWIR